jgi:plastocyanin
MALQTFEYLDNVAAAASDTDPNIIEINGDGKFSPDPSYVLQGESAVWLHNTNDTHTVTSDDDLFDSGGMDNGDAFSHTFDSLGTYSYSCSDHPGMNGTIVVLNPGFTYRPITTNWILQEGDFLEYDPGNIMDGVLKELNMQDMEVLHLTPIRLEVLADTGPGSPTGETCPDFGGQCHVIRYSLEFQVRGVNGNAEEDYRELSQEYEVTVYISAPYNGYQSTHEVGYLYSSEGTASGEENRSWRWMNETTRSVTTGAGNPATGGVPLEVSLGDNWTLTESEDTLSRSEEGCDQEVNSGVVMHSECGPWALTEVEARPPHSKIHTAVDLTGIELDVHNEADPDAASPTMFPVMFILEQGVNDPVGTSMELNGELSVHTTSGLPLYWEYDDESGLTGERPLNRYSIEGVADFDNDDVMNFYDLCPDTGAGVLADENGCSWEQYDDDDDGVLNNLDSCPDTTAGQSVDADGCAEYQKDTDEDGVSDADDACPGHDDAIDADEDDIPDGCDSLLDIDDGSGGDDSGGDDDGGFLPAPSLAASVAAVAVIALRRRR